MIYLRTAFLLTMLAAWLAQPAAAEILVGVAGPMHGQRAGLGSEMRRAADLAARQIKTSGGVLGQDIEVVSVDDGCAADQGVAAAQDLIARGVSVVIGHPCASAAIAAADLYAQANVIFIAPLTRHPVLTAERAGPTIFRLAGRDDRQGASAAVYLARAFPGLPLAVVYDGSRYAKQLADGVRAGLTEAGVSDILVESIASAQKDYTKLIANLEASRTQALYFAGMPIEAALLLKQMRAAGLSAAFIGSDALATQQFGETAGPDARGVLVLLPYDPSQAPAAKALRDKIAPQARKPSGAFVATYAAIEVWRAAVRKAQSLAPEAVSAALQQDTFETVLGPVSFGVSGDADIPDYGLVEWNGGAWQPKD